jgi:hypothetical protein
MEDCGLGSFVVPAPDFEGSFSKHVAIVLETDNEVWRRARAHLLRITDPEHVLTAYWEVCQAVTVSRAQA